MKKLTFVLLMVLIVATTSCATTSQTIEGAYKRSFTYEKSRDLKDAIRALLPVYKKYPDGYTVNLRLGWLYYLKGNYANSEFHYKKALKVFPYSAEAMLGLSLPYMAQKRWKDTEILMYKLIKIDFYNYYGNLRLAYVLNQEKKYSDAIKVEQKMLKLYPTDINFLTQLGLSYLYSGNKKYALDIFSNILILDPENITAKSVLGKKK